MILTVYAAIVSTIVLGIVSVLFLSRILLGVYEHASLLSKNSVLTAFTEAIGIPGCSSSSLA